MKPKDKPYRHEIKSKNKTQIVKDKTKYNRIDLNIIEHEFEYDNDYTDEDYDYLDTILDDDFLFNNK